MEADRARQLIATEAPRRLRFDELLAELGARDDPKAERFDPQIEASGSTARLELEPRRDHLTVGELVDKAAEAGFGFLVGILTLIAIPFFGLSTPFGLAIALIGIQMILGRHQPWLPRRARRRRLSMSMLDRVAGMLARRTRWLARSTRRRWELLLRPRVVGLGIVLLALGLALPLPIPGSNLVFLLPLFVYAVGLLERDGVWIAIGHACCLAGVALMVVFGTTVMMALERLWAWVS